MTVIIDDNSSKDVKKVRVTWKRTAEFLMAIRRWFTHEKPSLNHDAEELNIRRVFELNIDDPLPPKKKNLWRRIFLFSLDETGSFFYYWTSLIFLGCFYNLITIVVMIFEEVSKNFHREWIIGNIIFDCIFVLDIFILTRREIIKGGIRVTSVKAMLLERIKSKEFYLDLLAILPTDLVLLSQSDLSISRMNKLLKIYRVGEFYTLTEIRTTTPTLFRLFKLVFLCYIIFHWNGCIYFFISVLHDYKNIDADIEDWIFTFSKIPDPIFVTCNIFNKEQCPTDIIEPLREYEEWGNLTLEIEYAMLYWGTRSSPMVFSNFVKQYGLSFYWSALTLVTLGEQPWPNSTFQNSFEIVDTLLGLVIFAVIVGDVGNMVSTMNLKKTRFEEILDGTKAYMIRHKVSDELQEKVVRYFGYKWSQGQTGMDEEEISEFLPNRLYGQMAVHIHMETLRKVKLFEDCEANLLYELILKLELQVYAPMDYICRKGEIGKEMYIVKHGFVEVVSEDGTKVFVRLGEGAVFGELSILNIPGNINADRRTASVRSAGYTDLYALKKEHLWDALRVYPEAKVSLMKKGQQLLAKDNLLDESLVAEDNWDPDAPVEEKLQNVEETLKELEKLMEETEQKIQSNNTNWKKKITDIEKQYVDFMGSRSQSDE